jgi:hypothetical protein
MKEKEDIFISILRYGRELKIVELEEIYKLALDKGFLTEQEYNEIVSLPTKEISKEVAIKEMLLASVFKENYHFEHYSPMLNGHRLTTEGYFKLVEFTELQEARLAAKESKKYANIAFAISIITFFVTVSFSYIQLNNPVEISKPIKIDQSQIIELNNAIKSEISELKRNLDSIKLSVKEIKTSEFITTKNK